ncbi:hypothetical protein F5X99DRAFT_429072 [Biscogniauxia marginata]|nr:hypothetical protein F5X99DRAFT_429072 [Biscogniauxia marginata]
MSSNTAQGAPSGNNGAVGNGDNPPAPAYRGNFGRVVRVGDDWKFECQCGARVANRAHNISSHMSKHNPDSTYQKMYRRLQSPISCAEDGCGKVFNNRFDIINHYRKRHGHRGSSKPLLEKYGVEAADHISCLMAAPGHSEQSFSAAIQSTLNKFADAERKDRDNDIYHVTMRVFRQLASAHVVSVVVFVFVDLPRALWIITVIIFDGSCPLEGFEDVFRWPGRLGFFRRFGDLGGRFRNGRCRILWLRQHLLTMFG